MTDADEVIPIGTALQSDPSAPRDRDVSAGSIAIGRSRDAIFVFATIQVAPRSSMTDLGIGVGAGPAVECDEPQSCADGGIQEKYRSLLPRGLAHRSRRARSGRRQRSPWR